MDDTADPSALLHYQTVTASDAQQAPKRWLLVLHGILGSGRNWASIARGLVNGDPTLGVLLTDLRSHGRSPRLPDPQDIPNAAADVSRLIRHIEEGPVTDVLGHSFGGKVALQLALEPPTDLRRVFVIDSTPSARGPEGEAWWIVNLLQQMPPDYASRQACVEALTLRGVSQAVAQWLASSLYRNQADRYAWRFDLSNARAMLEDYFRRDLWQAIENGPDKLDFRVIRAENSTVLDDADRARLADLESDSGGRLRLHRLSGDHWLNASNPQGLIALIGSEQ